MKVENHLSKTDVKILLSIVIILSIVAIVSWLSKTNNNPIKEKTIIKTECSILEKTTEFSQNSPTEMLYLGINFKMQCGAMTINRSIDGKGSSVNRILEYSNLKVGDTIYLYQEK